MNLIIKPVMPNFLHQTWPLVEKFIADALQWSGDDYTLDQTKTFLANGNWLLIVAIDENNIVHGASAVNFFNMPNDRVAFVIAMGGKLMTNQKTFAQFTELLKSYGATKIQGAVRKSMARFCEKFGLKERYRIVEATL